MVGVAEDRPEGLADAAVGHGRGLVVAALLDEEEDSQGNHDRRDPEQHDGLAPAEVGDEPRPEDRHDDGPEVPAGDVGADREPAPVLRELFGQQPVADRVLRRPADPRHDVDRGKRREGRRRRLGREAAAEEDPAGREQLPPRDHPGELRVAELDRTRREASGRGEQRDRVGGDAELEDDPDVDERQQHRLRVVDGVGDRQQPERPVAVDVGWHG